MVVTEEWIQMTYPLHYAIWKGDEREMERLLQNAEFRKEHLEKLDVRGRTPLVLAVLKEKVSIVDKLINKYNADATFTQESGWNVIHEAVSVRNREILRILLSRRDLQRCRQQERLIPDLLQELKNAPDFYVEMIWEFSTWVPYVSRMLPAGQAYRVWKKGSSLRVDSSSSQTEWDTGITLIFKEEGSNIFMFECDHALKKVLKQIICSNDFLNASSHSNGRRYEEAISLRLVNPSVVSITDWKSVSFKRRQNSLTLYGNDELTETVNGFKCKVFESSGFGIETKFRTEHLREEDKSKLGMEQKPGMLKKILSYLSKYDGEIETETTTKERPVKAMEISVEEYFEKNRDENGRDVGPPRQIKSKRVKFDATVWVCEEYPLDPKEQLIPIVNLMSLTNRRFKSLKDFIELQMPGGFPVKLQVPIYHFINGKISFHNIFGTLRKMEGVTSGIENGKLVCFLEEKLFDPPADYETQTAICTAPDLKSDEEDFFGLFREGASDEPQVDIYEALNAPRALLRENTPDDAEEQMLQRAIEESLFLERLRSEAEWDSSDESLVPGVSSAFPLNRTTSIDELEKAIELSHAESEILERNRREEEETLKRVLEISLQEF